MKHWTFLLIALTILACNDQTATVEEDSTMANSERMAVLYDAFAAGNMEMVLANMADDVTWNEAENFIYGDNKTIEGKEAIVEGVFKRLGEDWEYWTLDDKQFYDVGGDRVLVTGRYKAKHKTTGKLLDSQFAHFWKLRDTLALSFQQYTDTKQASEVVMADMPMEE